MNRLTLLCLFLSMCGTSLAAGPPPQSGRQSSGESKCGAGFKACQESLKEFKEAKEFMQWKANALADLTQVEKSRPTKTKTAPVRDANLNRQKTGNGVMYTESVEPNRAAPVQATSAVRPVSLDSATLR